MEDIKGFIAESWDDLKSPTTSDFTSKIQQLKDLIGSFEQVVDVDRSGVTKLRKAIKAMLNSGNAQIENEKIFAESLEKLGNYSMQYESDVPELAEAFIKFAVVTKEVSALLKNLVANLRNSVMFPLEMFAKSDPRETHADCKKLYDKAHKELENKFHKVGKERVRIAESVGLHRKTVTGQEVAEDTDKERKLVQLHACEYLLRVNEARSRKGVDLLNHLVEYYQAQTSFFKDGMQTINHFNSYVTNMIPKLTNLKSRQDSERKQLVELKESLKSSLAAYKEDNSQSVLSKAAPLMPFIQSKEVGSEFVGYLLKKSEGMIKKMWQKRKCAIKDGVMSISHSDETKPPVCLNLLTCQAKVIPDDPGKKCFDLLSSSNNRTYHFQAEDEQDMVRWISVLNNAKEAQLMLAFSDNKSSQGNANLRELQKQLIAEIRKLPGNDQCCDCGAADPEWLSVNFGVIICLECCGVHRELGVHISRTQSLVIDELGTSQLLIASVMSNQGFNEIMEATLTSKAKDLLIKPDSSRELRAMYIRTKYESKRYAIKTCADTEELKQELYQAVTSNDIYSLLQVFAEGVDLLTALPGQENEDTALHKAIMQENGTSLYMIDFLVQNSDIKRLDVKDMYGNTALHIAARCNQGEAMKLILRANTSLASVKNNLSKTPIELAKENGYELCTELLQHALDGKSTLFENVNIDWLLMQGDYVDFSDDDLESQTPEKPRSRPTSMVSDMLAERRKTTSDTSDGPNILSNSNRMDRRKTGECIVDNDEKYTKEKRSTVDRMRRKTTDNVVSPLSTLSSGSNKGSIKSKPGFTAPFGHSRAVSDHTVSTFSNGDSTTDYEFKKPTFHSFTTSKTPSTNTPPVSTTTKQPLTVSSATLAATSNSTSGSTGTVKPAAKSANTNSSVKAGSTDNVGGVKLKLSDSVKSASADTAVKVKSVSADTAVKVSSSTDTSTIVGAITSTTVGVVTNTTVKSVNTDSNTSTSEKAATTGAQKAATSVTRKVATNIAPSSTVPNTASTSDTTQVSSSISPRNSVKAVNSKIVSPGTKGIAPPPLPEKRTKATPGIYDRVSVRRTWNGGGNVAAPVALSTTTTPTKDSSSPEQPTVVKPVNNASSKAGSKPEPTPRKGSVPGSVLLNTRSPLATSNKPAIRPKPQLTSTMSLPIRRRCRALYDCKADNVDELSFFKDEIIVILKSPADSNWWEGEIDGNPKRKGLFPTTHVAVVNDV